MKKLFTRIATVLATVALALGHPLTITSLAAVVASGCAVTRPANAFDVRMYGAKGDGVADDTSAIAAAMTAANATKSQVYFPAGTYLISTPLNFTVSMVGAGRNATTIKAAAGFTGTRMIDFNSGSERKVMRGLKFDAANVAGLQIFGSSSAGGAGGSSQSLFEDLWFTNTAAGVYAVGGSSSTTEAGMLTGATFRNCTWNGCSSWLDVGNNQDDVTFIGCRFTGDGATPTTFMLRASGKNVNFISSYINVANTNYLSSGSKFLMNIGSYEVKFSGCFFEGTTDATHIIYAGAPTSYLILENCHAILTAASLVAFVRTQVNATSGLATHEVRNFLISGATPPIWDVFFQNNTTSYLTLKFSGVDSFGSVFQWGSGSGGSESDDGNVRLVGVFQGKEYANGLKYSAGTATNRMKPLAADGRYGTYTYEAAATTASGASPAAQSFTLPSAGVWLVTVSAKVNGDKNHMLNGTYLVYFFDSTYDTLDTDQIGTTKKAVGSSFLLNDLTVTGPSTTGQLDYQASWSDGGSRAVTWVFTARKIQSFDGPWTI